VHLATGAERPTDLQRGQRVHDALVQVELVDQPPDRVEERVGAHAYERSLSAP
jgi:hypothetical protein